jgi:hypothetical protein
MGVVRTKKNRNARYNEDTIQIGRVRERLLVNSNSMLGSPLWERVKSMISINLGVPLLDDKGIAAVIQDAAEH